VRPPDEDGRDGEDGVTVEELKNPGEGEGEVEVDGEVEVRVGLGAMISDGGAGITTAGGDPGVNAAVPVTCT
jgi:hypothetical protein